jgi:hypothetical protein
MQLNTVSFENNLFSNKAKEYAFLDYRTVNRFTYAPSVEDETFNVMREFNFVLEDHTT